MYNLVKSEIYKLRYGKTYKGLGTLSLWCVLMTMIVSFNAKTVNLELIYGHFNNRGYGYSINTFANPDNLKGIEFFMSGIGWTPILVIGLMYLISSVTCDEYSMGTYKNILTYGYKRSNIYIAKLFTVCLGISILIFALPTLALALGTIGHGWGIPFKIETINEMTKLLGLIIIIFISIASVFMLLATLIKNKALIVTIGIVSLVSPLFLLGNMVSLETMLYYPIFMLMDICSQIPSVDRIYQIIVTCSIITVVFTILGVYVFKNQDIK